MDKWPSCLFSHHLTTAILKPGTERRNPSSLICYQSGCYRLCTCVDKTGLHIVQNPSYNRAVPERPKARRKPTGCICTFKSSGGVSELQRNFPTRVGSALQLNMNKRTCLLTSAMVSPLLALKTFRHLWLEPQINKRFTNTRTAILHLTDDAHQLSAVVHIS